MTTGAEHYRLAEAAMETAVALDDRGRHDAAAHRLRYATVHALLANAAAQALQHTQRDEWIEVTG